MNRVRARAHPRPRAGRAGTWAMAWLLVALASCGGGAAGASTSVSSSPGTSATGVPGPRPSSPAVVRIVEPTANASVTGTTLHVVLSLQNAVIVTQTSTDIRPDRGHVHLYVNGVLVSMNYGLTQDIAVHPGTWSLKAEFVASDHAPFSPRVWSEPVVFTVH